MWICILYLICSVFIYLKKLLFSFEQKPKIPKKWIWIQAKTWWFDTISRPHATRYFLHAAPKSTSETTSNSDSTSVTSLFVPSFSHILNNLIIFLNWNILWNLRHWIKFVDCFSKFINARWKIYREKCLKWSSQKLQMFQNSIDFIWIDFSCSQGSFEHLDSF